MPIAERTKTWIIIQTRQRELKKSQDLNNKLVGIHGQDLPTSQSLTGTFPMKNNASRENRDSRAW